MGSISSPAHMQIRFLINSLFDEVAGITMDVNALACKVLVNGSAGI